MQFKLIRGWFFAPPKAVSVQGEVSRSIPDGLNQGVNQGLRYRNIGVNTAPYDPNPQLSNFGSSAVRKPK